MGENDQKYLAAMHGFLMIGRMMSGTKIGPKGHVCLWNANILTTERGKIWFGDLDLTADEKMLVKLAADLGTKLYILREMDARFNREKNPAWDRAVACVTADGIEIQGETDR